MARRYSTSLEGLDLCNLRANLRNSEAWPDWGRAARLHAAAPAPAAADEAQEAVAEVGRRMVAAAVAAALPPAPPWRPPASRRPC
mmetsp:Transcript_95445/g.242570  ORF Transcript_95445/g.242570 Transcript_95445/m.242570 type:complete len:85 (-) Transcript_95445:205-459(-)